MAAISGRSRPEVTPETGVSGARRRASLRPRAADWASASAASRLRQVCSVIPWGWGLVRQWAGCPRRQTRRSRERRAPRLAHGLHERGFPLGARASAGETPGPQGWWARQSGSRPERRRGGPSAPNLRSVAGGTPASQEQASRGGGYAAIPCATPRHWPRGRRCRAARRRRGGTGPRRSSRGVPDSVGRRPTGWDAAADHRRRCRYGPRQTAYADRCIGGDPRVHPHAGLSGPR